MRARLFRNERRQAKRLPGLPLLEVSGWRFTASPERRCGAHADPAPGQVVSERLTGGHWRQLGSIAAVRLHRPLLGLSELLEGALVALLRG